MDQLLILRKLRELERYTKELKRLRGKSLEHLRASLATSWAVEHGLQLAIQVTIDVGNHILVSLEEHQIEEYADVIDKLGTRGILPKTFAQQIREMAGFRNLLVHEYAEVDLEKVHGFLKTRLGDFSEFARYIRRYLKKPGRKS